MVAKLTIPDLKGVPVEAVYNTKWYVDPQLMGGASLLAFQHPAFGPLGFLVPIEQVEQMLGYLSAQVEQAKASREAKLIASVAHLEVFRRILAKWLRKKGYLAK